MSQTNDVELVMVDPEDKDESIAFSRASVRRAFVRKVFAIVSLMLGICFLMSATALVSDSVNHFLRSHGAFYYIGYVVFIAIYIALGCFKSVRRRYPLNVILLAVFTLSLGFMLMCMVVWHPPYMVLLVFGVSSIICVAIIIFAIQTKYDITSWGFILFVACLTLFVSGIALGVLSLFIYVQWLHMLFSAAVSVLFMVYLAYDIQLIMGNKKNEYSPEDYVLAAMQLFLDIVMIFMNLLGLSAHFN